MTLNYPVIVVNKFDLLHGTMKGAETTDSGPIREPFQMEVNYAYVEARSGVAKNEHFLIDVLSMDTLPKFVADLVDQDVSAIWQMLRG